MRLRLQLSLAGVLALLILLARAPLAPSPPAVVVPPPRVQDLIVVEDIVRTVQPRPRVEVATLPLVGVVEVADEIVVSTSREAADASLESAAPTPEGIEGARAALPPPPPLPAPAEAEPDIFVVVEQMPQIEGGLEALYAVLRYPEMARLARVEGRVVVEVIVNADGRPAEPRVVRSANPMLDEAAVEAAMQLIFIPGRQRGKAVRVRYTIPIRFALTG